jgi:hypothetical protein
MIDRKPIDVQDSRGVGQGFNVAWQRRPGEHHREHVPRCRDVERAAQRLDAGTHARAVAVAERSGRGVDEKHESSARPCRPRRAP